MASSSSLEWVEKYLNPLGICEYFECIRTADHVAKVKPDPELYNQTLACLGITADEAVAIEDSPNGSKAAAAAGTRCIVTPNEITNFLEFDKQHHKIDNLSLLEFDHVVTQRLFCRKK
ncbi:HAD-IA family hydrolase [Paenibacillus etheri]|uniref:HAD-IA family hydrolase n=1 Tax=Paenibacillus etheri TaxID=1306852 RepID=UPI001FD842C6|nr:HAD-IA family hydrolase [Paenibacillus etheri]